MACDAETRYCFQPIGGRASSCIRPDAIPVNSEIEHAFANPIETRLINNVVVLASSRVPEAVSVSTPDAIAEGQSPVLDVAETTPRTCDATESQREGAGLTPHILSNLLGHSCVESTCSQPTGCLPDSAIEVQPSETDTQRIRRLRETMSLREIEKATGFSLGKIRHHLRFKTAAENP